MAHSSEGTRERSIPARISDGDTPDLHVLTLGDVDSPLAQSVYHPNCDRLELKGGGIIEGYVRDRLEIRYFAPLDKERHPLPPAGWCSWYYYYRQITPEEMRRNAEWLAEKLRDYGLRYVQLDDGWQADGDDPQTPRDWSGTNEAAGWSEAELHRLAVCVREMGMLPGIWIAPHGQSNDSLTRRWGCFVMEEDGSSGSVTWVGRWLLDPSHPRADQYLRELFRKMKGEWDFAYFKIDGQPTVLAEYAERSGLMVEPGEVEALYRGTVQAIREEIGDDSFLLGCWGTPLAGMGLMSGSRTGEDVVLGGDGFRTAFRTMLRWGFLNNIAWYGDPDVVLLRPPLPIETARAWATVVALSGHALFLSDRMEDLPESRVEIARRVLPAVDVSPMDLFRPENEGKRIWDLKIGHLGREYEVVGCFNLDGQRLEQLHLSWGELGLEGDALYHVFDFWAGEYLGCWEAGYFVEVAPEACRLVSLVRAEERPVLVSTSRHVTQGWVDLLDIEFSEDGLVFEGASRLVGGDPLILSFAHPRTQGYRIVSAEADCDEASHVNHDGWSRLRLFARETGEYRWKVRFEHCGRQSFPVSTAEWKSERASIERRPDREVIVRWPDCYFNNAGYLVSIDGEPVGVTPINRAVLRPPFSVGARILEIRPIWHDGMASPKAAEIDLSAVP